MFRTFFLFLVLLLVGPIYSQAEPVKLRITLQLPIASHLGANLVQFKEEVERRSKGAIAVEIYDDSRLYRDDRAVGAVESAAIEMTSVTAKRARSRRSASSSCPFSSIPRCSFEPPSAGAAR
jgi:TRAP-type C4-dicarboxylate transport system substrate-binding protein